MGKRKSKNKNIEPPKPTPTTPPALLNNQTFSEEEPTMTDATIPVDPIEELVQTIHTKIRESNAQEIVGRLIFEKIFSLDTDVLNPWQLYTKKGRKTYDEKYSRYEQSWNSIVEKLSYIDIDLLRKWYRIEACKELEKEIRQRAKDEDIEVVATIDWTPKRIDATLRRGKGKEWISIQIMNWLDLKEMVSSGKKKKGQDVSSVERLEKKIAGLEKVVNDSFLWKRLTNQKTYDGMNKKKIDEIMETLTKAAERLSGLAKGAETTVMLKKQQAEK